MERKLSMSKSPTMPRLCMSESPDASRMSGTGAMPGRAGAAARSGLVQRSSSTMSQSPSGHRLP